MHHPDKIKYAGSIYVLAADRSPQMQAQRAKLRMNRIQVGLKIAGLQLQIGKLRLSVAAPDRQEKIQARMKKITERVTKLTATLQALRSTKRPTPKPAKQ